MIRTILAVVLTVALFAISMPAVDHVAGQKAEASVDNAVAKIENAAESLLAEEEVPPRGVKGPQRVITVTFPAENLLSKPVREFRIVPEHEKLSVVRYTVKGRAENTRTIDAPVVSIKQSDVTLGSPTGEATLYLTLLRDGRTDDPLVVVTRAPCVLTSPDKTRKCQ